MKVRCVKRLQEIPRVGEKLADRLIAHFGSEDKAINAIIDGDIAEIARIDGVGQKFAVKIVQEASIGEEDEAALEFLKTNEAKELYNKLLNLIKTFAPSNYSKEKVGIYFPYPATYKNNIERNRETITPYIEIASSLATDKDFMTSLKKIKPLNIENKGQKVRDRVLITVNEKDYIYAKNTFSDMLSVVYADTPRHLNDIVSEYNHVILAHKDLLDMDLPDNLNFEFISDIKKADEWEIVPEKVISFYSKNLDVIKSTLKVIHVVQENGFEVFDYYQNLDFNRLNELLESIDQKGDIKSGIDPNIDHLRTVIQSIEPCINKEVIEGGKKIESLLEEKKLTISGQEMMRVISGDLEVKDLFEKEIYNSYIQIINDTKKNIAEELSLNQKNTILLDSIFSTHITYPLEIDSSAISSLKSELEKQILIESNKLIKTIAKKLAFFKSDIEKMVKDTLDFGLKFGIGHFSYEYKLTMPNIIEDKGIGFKNGRNLFLQANNNEITPVTYCIGSPNIDSNNDSRKIIILSGVNSGGKTSLIELIGQCIILTHMGFPVPCDYMDISLTENLYYFGKSKGTLDAGAFESTLVQFASLSNSKEKTVLVDELESITEPGASAKIVAGILEMLEENENSISIFVSHLASEIQKNTECNIRIDGIEAKGLDSNLNLVVNRNPQYNCIAKSTPELIVERLARKNEGEDRLFYDKLRNKFR